MKHCSICGALLEYRIPKGDHLPRYVCPQCKEIHYQNPKLVIGCIVRWEGKILLCRRAIEPQYGLWTLPAGFMENGETTVEAARRETLEETCAEVVIDALYRLINIAHINQVHLFYRGHLLAPVFGPAPESLETALFSEAEIPWEELAFRSVTRCLKDYVADCRQGNDFPFREQTLEKLV